MTEDHPSQVDIEELRRRWDAEPSPQLSLQLAEEYRRAERTEEAVFVLEAALESHPEHVAARVALGRYLMEVGRHQEARAALEAIVAEDPTHLVANKALVKLYVRLGEEKQAQDRLDLYKILNEGDPEIEELALEISGEPATEPSKSPRPDLPLFTSIRSREPFSGLGARVRVAEYWQAVGSEGIFPVGAAAAATAIAIEPDVGQVEEEAALEEEIESQPSVEAEMATVTLANLYLEQGHLDEAERTFQEVLAVEPENPEAVAGLEAVSRRRAGPLGEGVDARKVTMLKSYLERIRSSAKG